MINRHIRRKLKVTGESVPYVGYGPSSRETVLPEIFTDLNYKVGAEIGVRRGEFTRVLLEKVPGLKMYCVDPWTPYRNASTQRRQDRHKDICVENLKGLNAEFVVKTNENALKDFQDGSLDFVYIDALHDFDNVMFDILGWSNKVKSGGIVSGHDFIFYHNMGVIFAVEAYVRGHNITQWYMTKDYPNSWFWVKP